MMIDFCKENYYTTREAFVETIYRESISMIKRGIKEITMLKKNHL